MLSFAHRGYHAHAPENSLAAFEAAVRLGVDGIETDVRVSRDGLPVIIHDRVTPGQRPVAELTRREIETDLGHGIATLDEILERFAEVYWNIELKTTEALGASVRALTHFKTKRRLLVSSFRHDVVSRCARELDIDCALLLASRPLDVNALMADCAPAAAIRTIVWDYNVLDETALQAVAANGWANFVYGAVTQDEHARCRQLPVTGLITDFPERSRGSQR